MTIEITERDYNLITQALRHEARVLLNKQQCYDKESLQYKSFCRSYQDVSMLIYKLRKYKKDED